MVSCQFVGFLSDGLVSFLNIFISSTNPIVSILSGFILSALFLPMVLLGLHHGLIPIYLCSTPTTWWCFIIPSSCYGGLGQVGAAIAIYVKAKRRKNERLQKTIIGALPVGFLGVGEPLIYGVTLPLGKPFITMVLVFGFGGAWVMLTGVMAGAWGPSGLVAIPLMQTPTMMLNFFIGLVISYVAGFIITMIFIKDDLVENN
ncbi:PTS transporter subunit EIIC [Erysipelothrix sp. D19-032]